MMKKKVILEIASYKSCNKNKRLRRPLQENCSLPNRLTIIVIIIMLTTKVTAAPHEKLKSSAKSLNQEDWPTLEHHDIWGDENLKLQRSTKNQHEDEYDNIENQFESDLNLNEDVEEVSNQFSLNLDAKWLNSSRRQNKAIHLFSVPDDGECLSDDGRRSGTCYNAYECRNKGGQAKGDCALGYGVCCIFIADCNVTISNNITYLVSPGFPSFMPNNVTNCNLKIKILHDDISQLRFDFNHFVLGQPNRRTGVCDGDWFEVSGGPGGPFLLCGQNSGQHMYYDVGGRMLARQTLYGSLRPISLQDLYPGFNASNDMSMEIVINLNFAARYLPTRLWEIRITQIPFSQRAPAGCLQYFTGIEGIFQTYNFADNGRHLANHNYRICMRQEVDMCSIVYQPCDEQSFRIGPSSRSGMVTDNNGQSGGIGVGIFNPDNAAIQMDITNNRPTMDQVLADDSGTMQMGMTTATATGVTASSSSSQETTATTTTRTEVSSSTATIPNTTSTPTVSSTSTVSAPPAADAIADDAQSSSMVVSSTTSSNADASSTSSTPLNDDVEGSGGDANDDDNTRFRPTPGTSAQVSRRPRPTRGGFDLLGFLRTAFDLGFRSQQRQVKALNSRHNRQFFSTCRDRITMPCIVEDFIGAGLGPLPGCEPVHCGMQFCSNGLWPCRIESTVTPFYVSIHFGDGLGKGSAEDNIGACLKYQQIQCMR